MVRTSFLSLLFLVFSFTAFAQNRCVELFSGASDEIRWDFVKAEFEAKFMANKDTFNAMKNLVGKRVHVPLADGGSVEYQIEFNRKHIYEDVYYDTKKLRLYSKEGLLRQRSRWDKGEDDNDYKFKKVVFQAKSEDKGDKEHLNEAFMARDEIPGKEFKKKISKKKTRSLLQSDSEDEAVQFARGLIDFSGEFKPVLKATQNRYFIRLSPVDGGHTGAPSFYLSLDDVSFKGLTGQEGKDSVKVVELETIEVLDKSDPALLKKRVQVANAMATLIQSQYGLARADKDKYSLGIELTVLKK